MNITFPSNTTEVIDQMRLAIGRDVTFYIPSYTSCTVCELDPVTNTSTDSFCPACSGLHWIPVYSGYTTSGHITWGKGDITTWYPGGQMIDGDCRIQVKYSDTMVTVLSNTEYVVADNKTLEIKSKIYRGVPEINRILIDLIERNG